jgi:DNA repair protein SbcD/Mre11
VAALEPFRFLHTGDLHLDSPVEGLGAEAPPDVLGVLRAATSDAWRNVVRLAIDEAVDFVVVAGDVFERTNPSLLAQTRFRDGLAELDRARIASFVVHGNHDPLDGRSWAAGLAFPPGAFRFGSAGVSSRAFVRDGREIARVYGRSYPQAAVTANYAAAFRREPDVPFAIGLLHTNVGDRPGHANYAPCRLEDLRAADMDYWALGHIHQPAIVLDDPAVVYCGNPQGRDPGEMGARGCYIVDVGPTGRPEPRFVPCDAVRWVVVNLSIDALDDDDALQRAAREALIGAVERAEGRSLVVRMRLTGRGALHASLRRSGYLVDLRQLLNEERSAAPPFAWLESIHDETRADVDLAARRATPDFVGDFLQTAAEARRSAATTDPEAYERWQRLLRGAIAPLFDESQRGRRHLASARPSDAALTGELLDEAESLGLDLLLAAEEQR